MRPPTLVLVALTSIGWLLLRVEALEPFNFTLSPSSLARGEPYSVTWINDRPYYIGGLYLVQVVDPPTNTMTVQTIISSTALPYAALSSTTFIYIGSESPLSLFFEAQYAAVSTSTVLTTATQGLTTASSSANAALLLPARASGSTAIDNSATATGGSIVGAPSQFGIGVSPTSSVISAGSSSPNADNANGASSGLSTGAKVGIAVGAIGASLLILIVIILLWRRSRRRKSKSFPGGTMAYTDDRGSSMNRDLHAEKDMQVLSSSVGPYTTQETGRGLPYVGSHSPEPQQPPRAETHSTSESWPHDNRRGSYDAGESHVPPQAPTPPAVAPSRAATTAAPASTIGSNFPRKPVGGTATLIQEPGMSDDEVARLEEEERRIDEAIAEAEQRRNGPLS